MKLLIAYDGSPAADAAVRAAAVLFPGAAAVVLAVHEPVVGPERVTRVGGGLMSASMVDRTLAQLAREHVEQAQATADAGAQLSELPAATAVGGDHSPWKAILAAAAEHDADAILCGTRGSSAVARFVLGSTSSGLLHHADRPVLVVPDGDAPSDGPTLIAYDGSDAAQHAIAEAARLLPGRPALVVHAWKSPYRHSVSGRALRGAPVEDMRAVVGDVESWLRESADAMAAEGAGLAQAKGLEAGHAAVESSSSAWRAVAATAETRQAAVIVVGSQGKGGATSVLLGSVSSGLVHHAERPVLIVRP